MKRLKTLLAIAGLVTLPLLATPAGAVNLFEDVCNANQSGQEVRTSTVCVEQGAQGERGTYQIIENVINAVLYLAGIIAVIFIIIGGVKYTLSQGDASRVQGAKNTILYAVVGLVVAILSFAIVSFVLNRLQ